MPKRKSLKRKKPEPKPTLEEHLCKLINCFITFNRYHLNLLSDLSSLTNEIVRRRRSGGETKRKEGTNSVRTVHRR